jgi:hypothetical protein
MKSIKLTVLLASLAAVLAANAAEAQSTRPANNYKPNAPAVSYTYVGARYMSQDLDKYDCDQDGINLYGSLDIQDGWFAKAGYTDVSGDICGSSSVAAGGGYHTRFDQRMDMYATLSFESVSPDEGPSDSGLVMAGGLRGFLTGQLEGGVELFHSTTGDGTTGISGLLAYWFNDAFAITGDVGLASEVTTFAVGARLNF